MPTTTHSRWQGVWRRNPTLPAPITDDTLKVAESHNGPSLDANSPANDSVPRLPVKLADVEGCLRQPTVANNECRCRGKLCSSPKNPKTRQSLKRPRSGPRYRHHRT